MSCLMYPAMQKYYSALNNLENFRVDNDFFENISSLDTFFSEFRNITFVLQKSIAHTDFKLNYDSNREKFLSDSKWFVDKRNETTKQQPFQLQKDVEITIYQPHDGFRIFRQRFKAENDIEISSLIEKFKQLFKEISSIEVFFSVRFSFFESNSDMSIYTELKTGVTRMQQFLNAMRKELNENCELCNQIDTKINKMKFMLMPSDMFLCADYVYYPKQERFDKASRTAIVIPIIESLGKRLSLMSLKNGPFRNIGEDCFEIFIIMHLAMGKIDLMPVIMTIYEDETYELDPFDSDLKTTTYRKISELASKIVEENVKEIYFMHTYLNIPVSPNLIDSTTIERSRASVTEFLTFIRVGCNLTVDEISFDKSRIDCMHYVSSRLDMIKKNKLKFGEYNMIPIINAFKEKQAK